jgi:phosphate transport system permease protein
MLSRVSRYLFLAATLAGVAVLVFLAYDTISTGWSRLSIDFLRSYPSRHAEEAGIRPGIYGSAWVLACTMVASIPVAIGTAIWIEEFAPRNRLLTIVKINLANLAGVPSIIYGILGLAIFVRFYEMERSILAAGFTLALMIIPMTVIASQEAIRQVPPSLRDGALALGATRWQAVRHNVLPNAIPGIMTGVILAVSRAAGETAALVMIGGYQSIRFDPGPSLGDFLNPAGFLDGLKGAFTVLPIQIYGYTTDSRQEFRANATAGIVVLMAGVLTLNLIAAVIRERFRRY